MRAVLSNRKSLLIGMLAGVLGVMLLAGAGRAQDAPQPAAAPAGQARYQMAMAGTRACWVMDTATGEMFKCVTDSGYNPVECEWFRCGSPKSSPKQLNMR
jgi:hypothetical protein